MAAGIGTVAALGVGSAEAAGHSDPTVRQDLVWSQREISPPDESHVVAPAGRSWLYSQDILQPLTMAGLLWDGGSVSEAWLQTRDETGEWSDWTEIPIDADHEEDATGARPGSSPVYTGLSAGVRFAILGSIHGSEAMLIDTTELGAGGSGGSAAFSSPQPSVPLPIPWWSGPAFVRDRSQWDTSDCRRPGAEFHLSTPRAIVVHHTAGSNTYTQAEVPEVITGHCLFHVNGRGWDDLAYNFMVDRFGTVWEGRTASKSAAIRGGHTAGFNAQTQGIAMMGNFQTSPPTATHLSGLSQILDWMTGWYSLDPTGTVTLYAGSGNRRGWETDEPIEMPTIVGHRDLGSTSCPGGAFYANFADLRASVVPTSFGFDPSAVTCFGLQPTIYGTLGHDQIRGTPGSDVIHSLDGSDLIFGVEGDDVVCGGLGNDHLIPGGGVDSVDGGPGSDLCGGEGRANCEALGNDEIFFYRDDGLYRYYDIAESGLLPAPMLAGPGYTTGWSSITAVDLDGDGQDEMFFYRDDGLFRYYDIKPDGQLGAPIRAGSGYTAGWTSITSVDLDGDRQDEMFFYRDDGLFRYYDVDESGNLGNPIRAGDNYTTGWSSITAVDLGGDLADEMLFYRGDGLFRYYDVGWDGALPSPLLAGSGYTTGWSAISAIDLDGDAQDEMFFYRSDGLFRYYQIGEDAALGSPISRGSGYTKGWSAISAVDLDFVPYVTPQS